MSNNIKKREIYQAFEFGGRKWRVGKFDAMTGSYIAYKLMSELLPMGLGTKIGLPESKGASKTAMSKKDFFELQKDCLSVCEELIDAGPTCVLNEDGSWGVIDVERDAPLVLALTIRSLAWNVSSFFDESLLTSLAGALGLSRPEAEI